MVMITIHELGHYIAGKMLGFKINEFSIGFGKAIFKRQSKKTGEIFAIRMIPLGGYCAFEGGDEADSAGHKVDPNAEQQHFPDATGKPFNEMHPWKRLVVLFSGALANFLSAIIFSAILLMIVGYYQGVRIGDFTNDSPNQPGAVHATGGNLQTGDVILAINGERFVILNNFNVVMSRLGQGEHAFLIRRDGVEKEVNVIMTTLVDDVTGRQYTGIGINMHPARGEPAEMVFHPMGFFESLWRGLLFSFELAWFILVILWSLITGRIGLEGVGGPMATMSVMAQSISMGFVNIFLLLPLLSVNLAVFNLLPIPALDGARMVFVGIEWVRGRPINPDIEGRIHFIGLIVLMGLVVFFDINFFAGGGGRFNPLDVFGRLRL